ncbi:unnamed protein product [Dicrocoelium dendriticum]|nr:unnamed protein product [Dicrocoelium dendriticum]
MLCMHEGCNHVRKKHAEKMFNDLLQVWDSACKFTREKLLLNKAVVFWNIGCFRLCPLNLPVGYSSSHRFTRPVFILSEKICNYHGIQQHNVRFIGSSASVSLNQCKLSSCTGLSREAVEDCLHHVLATIHHGIHTNQVVEILFNDIGQLRISNNKVKFRFFNSFLLELDNTGTLINAMRYVSCAVDDILEKFVRSKMYWVFWKLSNCIFVYWILSSVPANYIFSVNGIHRRNTVPNGSLYKVSR